MRAGGRLSITGYSCLEMLRAPKYLSLDMDTLSMTEDFDDLEKKVIRIAEIAKKLPDNLQQQGFEFLLSTLMTPKISETAHGATDEKATKKPAPPREFTVPIDVRAFMQQYNVPEENLQKLFYIRDGEIRATYKIRTTKKAKAQIQIAELAALESALQGEKFEFSFENVRVKCKDHKCYDQPNFAKIFRNNSNHFKNLSDEEHVELSPDGKASLAETILELSK